MSNRNIFAENLQKYMLENNVSRKELSEALQISYFTITSWVNGKKYPRMDKVEMLANYFGVQKSDLIEDKHSEPANDDGLSDNMRKLIEFAKSVPEEKADMILRVMRSIVESD